MFNFNNEKVLLSHGDALCIDDTDYINFRNQVRNTKWQNDFLNNIKRVKTKNLMLHAYKIKFMIKNVQYNFKAKYNNEFEDFLKKI